MKTQFVFLVSLLLASCSDLPINMPREVVIPLPILKDFEASDFDGFYLETASADSATIVPILGYLGSKAAKMSVAPGQIVNNGNRSELALYNVAPYGDTVFFGWRFFIPLSDPDDFQWQILSQWYQLPDFVHGETFDFNFPHPPVDFVYVPGFVEIFTNVGGEKRQVQKPITKGAWHLMVFEIKFSDAEDGYLQAWLDGTAITPDNGTDNRLYHPTLHNRAGCYWKLGLYRGLNNTGQAPSANTVYLDNVAVGRSYAEVSP